MFFFNKNKDTKNPANHPVKVGEFYDKNHEAFLKVYGEIIQAFRTNDLSKILDYQIGSIGLSEGQRVLDAGCGVCGPARYFAKNAGCQVDAVTISNVQLNASRQLIEKEGLSNKITVHRADYHTVDSIFPADTFDRVYFLESFGHSTDKEKLLKAVWKVLKPGGEVYIKDLFIRKMPNASLQKRVQKEINKINEAYYYDVAELGTFVDLVRQLGYVISFIKTIDISLEDFENLAISNEFQDLTGIAQIQSWNNYIFPIDFLEVKLYKPEYDTAKGMHRYFIQNLFQIRIEQVDKSKL